MFTFQNEMNEKKIILRVKCNNYYDKNNFKNN